jgi:hypothetical protein
MFRLWPLKSWSGARAWAQRYARGNTRASCGALRIGRVAPKRLSKENRCPMRVGLSFIRERTARPAADCHTSRYAASMAGSTYSAGVGRVMEPEHGEHHRPAGSHGVDGAERAFLHAGADDHRGQPDQLVDVGGTDELGVGHQRPIGSEQLRVVRGPDGV